MKGGGRDIVDAKPWEADDVTFAAERLGDVACGTGTGQSHRIAELSVLGFETAPLSHSHRCRPPRRALRTIQMVVRFPVNVCDYPCSDTRLSPIIYAPCGARN